MDRRETYGRPGGPTTRGDCGVVVENAASQLTAGITPGNWSDHLFGARRPRQLPAPQGTIGRPIEAGAVWPLTCADPVLRPRCPTGTDCPPRRCVLASSPRRGLPPRDIRWG